MNDQSRTLKSMTAKGIKKLSASISRLNLATRAGLRFGGLRDYYKVFGYKTNITYQDALNKYRRQDIAARVIDAPPGATWSNPPTFSDDVIQAEFDALNKEHQIWDKLRRVDRLARLGHYSLLLFGFERSPLDQPVSSDSGSLIFIRPISIDSVVNIKLDTNTTSALFGTPSTYELKKLEDSLRASITPTTTTHAIINLKVDASKVVHIVENALEDDVFGIPIIERTFNLLDDLMKVAGGTAETFWITANRGMHIDIDKEMDLDEADQRDLADEIDEYIHDLRRSIRTKGVKVTNLGSNTPLPEQAFSMIISLLSGATGIPKRILLGSEAGQLASEQDRANWAERIEERSTTYAEPHILRPTISILQKAGIISEGDYDIIWPSAFRLSPLEEGMVAAQFARAIGNISRQTKPQMQITSVEEARSLVGLEGDLPESELIEPEPEPIPEAAPANNPRS